MRDRHIICWTFPYTCSQTYPIHLAACSLSLPVLEILLEGGAFVNQTDADMWTTLHFAALTGWADGIRMLLEVPSCSQVLLARMCSHVYFAYVFLMQIIRAAERTARPILLHIHKYC